MHRFLTAIERTHGHELRRFIASRLGKGSADIPDLIQEIYLRLLRIKDHEAIRNPQAYLITMASHVIHQYRLQRLAQPETMDPLKLGDEASGIRGEAMGSDPAEEFEIVERLERLERDLLRVSPRAFAVLVMYRCEGMSLTEIGQRLGVSHVMVRRYLSRAIAYCDQRLEEME